MRAMKIGTFFLAHSVVFCLAVILAACHYEEGGAGGAICPVPISTSNTGGSAPTPCVEGEVVCPMCSYGGMDTPAGESPPPCPELRSCCAGIESLSQCANRDGIFLTLGADDC